MRIIFTISIILFSFLYLNAQQEFAPIGAKWWYTPHCQTPNCGQYTLEVIGDTLINGVQASILEYAKDMVVIPEANQIMYGNGNQVFFYIDGEFELLYNFAAEVGDTITSKIGPFYSYFTYGSGIEDLMEFKYRIDSVGTIEMDNQILKIQYTGLVEVDETIYAPWGFGKGDNIIEKIGFTGYGSIFGHSHYGLLGGWEGSLKCYQDNDIFYKTINGFCDSLGIPMVSNKNIFQEIDFQISPNPASDFINITYDLPDEFHAVIIQIIDLNGRIIEQRKLENNKGTVDWNTTQLSNGLHFYHLKNEEKIIYTGKLLIMK